jgi:hypothetical protein
MAADAVRLAPHSVAELQNGSFSVVCRSGESLNFAIRAIQNANLVYEQQNQGFSVIVRPSLGLNVGAQLRNLFPNSRYIGRSSRSMVVEASR